MTKNIFIKEDWLKQLTNMITSPSELLQLLSLKDHPDLTFNKNIDIKYILRVPRTFVKRMTIGNAQDPLLLQVLISNRELNNTLGYSIDPLNEKNSFIPGFLRKYKNRALLLVKGQCAINCRYCFRRYFPYQDFSYNKRTWQLGIDYIASHPEIDEIILSGGDPLMAKDKELAWLIGSLSNILHLKRIRIHSRLPIVIPSRITENFCQIFSSTSLQVLLVTHINHAQEIDDDVRYSMQKLKYAGITLLNQSVLLHKVNDKAQTLVDLSNALFDAGILPYYLHVLDKVKGAEHFFVADNEARTLLRQMITMVSGYMVPKLTREIPGEASKTLLDLYLRQE